ncbi:MAG: GFA family protein, partial [Gammaproteobacteria bacterium]
EQDESSKNREANERTRRTDEWRMLVRRRSVCRRSAYYCHCKTCQKSSGQPAEIAVPLKSGTLRFTNGEPKYFASSAQGRRGFCSECGSRLIWRPTSPDYDWLTNVDVCSLDNPEEVRPKLHIFADRGLSWFRTSDDLPRRAAAEADDVVAEWKAQRT